MEQLAKRQAVQEKLFSLEYARFAFILRSKAEAWLPPYTGSTLRGAMGNAFRRNACMTKKNNCTDCMFISQCAYAYIFETSQLNVAEHIGHRYVPHPFVIEPPLEGKMAYQAGDSFEFHLLLIGRGIEFLPFFIAAFAQAAANGFGTGRYPFRLDKVEQVLPQSGRLIWDGGSNLRNSVVAERCQARQEDMDKDRHQLSIVFKTPARLVDRGQLSTEPGFQLIMRNIFRRLDLLGRAHGSGPLELPFAELLQAAEQVRIVREASSYGWSDWQRYSNRQQTSLMMGGIVGRIIYQGDLEEFMPHLRMAEVIHLGKGSVFGLGNLKIEQENGI